MNYLTLAEVSREYRLSKATVHSWVNVLKILPASQPVQNGKKFVRRSDVEALLGGRARELKRRKTILDARLK
jgi:predicted site-specific integrase-resolvase